MNVQCSLLRTCCLVAVLGLGLGLNFCVWLCIRSLFVLLSVFIVIVNVCQLIVIGQVDPYRPSRCQTGLFYKHHYLQHEVIEISRKPRGHIVRLLHRLYSTKRKSEGSGMK